eukprot:TRINITY_DN4832_c0_g1_i1.p1 TRINITY_DN4832_c0_g1~~TRINITY_DN4832_c0_g1_i1.p1  ORF type:complete len:487 (-),score=129.39 TRINITY_DN4832_c0_g1_i1:19-1479(-)
MTTQSASGYYWQGNDTLKIPYTMHKENRDRLLQDFNKGPEVPQNSFILLEGGKSETRYDTDADRLFRQESFFQWTFGVNEPDFYGAIDIHAKKSILFVPRLPAEYAVWLGAILPPSFFLEKYGVDEVKYADEMEEYFKGKNTGMLYTLHGLNTDSGNFAKAAEFKGIEAFKVDNERLFPSIVRCRVYKSAKEIEVLRYVNKISSEAHKHVMRVVRPGMFEYQAESAFMHYSYHKGGCRNMSYTCICASGNNGSVLHYGHSAAPNDKGMVDGDMCLFDMGAEYHCYVSDITCSFPVNGKFTEDQKIIYNAVLNAQRGVEAVLKPGIKYQDMHRLAERYILQGLIAGGILHNGSVEEMEQVYLGAVFMPHGLGHLMGLDTHDVGGYAPESISRSTAPGIKKLRTARVMEEGIVLTVEPGCYFIDHLLDAALNHPDQSKFINASVLSRFRNFGGVRLEDDVLITKDGCEVLTQVPRTVDEIEIWMQHRD